MNKINNKNNFLIKLQPLEHKYLNLYHNSSSSNSSSSSSDLILIKYRNDTDFNHKHNITKSIYVTCDVYNYYKFKLKLWKRFKKYNKYMYKKYTILYVHYSKNIISSWEEEIFFPFIQKLTAYDNLSY